MREDVGRHNAIDKVLGALARPASAGDGFVVVTSRASFELVQKAAVCGVPILAAISRPTGLAVRMAEAAGMSLVGLVRGRSENVYAQAWALVKRRSRIDTSSALAAAQDASPATDCRESDAAI